MFARAAGLSVLVAVLGLSASCAAGRAGADASPVGVSVPWAPDRCHAPRHDRDVDGVDDGCELALAQAFAPELVVDPRDCSWDRSAQPARLGGAYVFVAQGAADRDAIRIAYMPAYYRDCGWDGLPCVARGPDCAAHAGDSELIVVDARYRSPGRWVADAVFLSAHCFGRSDGRCRWYRGGELRRFGWSGGVRLGAPRVWVARGKHANYPSASACDAGHWYYDSCDGNAIAYRFPVLSSVQNVGSRRMPLPQGDAYDPAGCLRADVLPLASAGADPGTRECFWDPAAPFRGWQRVHTGQAPTPYAVVLHHATQF